MRLTWPTEVPQWAVLAGMFLLAAVTWPIAPDRIPLHWNVVGEVDRYGGKGEGLLALPLAALGIYLLMVLLPRVDPGRANYPRFASAYLVIRASIVMLLAVLYGLVHLWIRGIRVDVATVTPLLVGALFVVLGNLLGKIRPNWFVGIRTPWTLSSKMAWTRTHRLGGWLFILAGLLIMAAGVVRHAATVWVIVAVVIGMTTWTTLYSYFVWRVDPDKVPPAGTWPAEEP